MSTILPDVISDVIGLSAIRRVAAQYLPGMLGQGLSANSILGLLKRAGLGYRRTDFLADLRKAKKVVLGRDYVMNVPTKLHMNIDRIASHNMVLPYGFQYKVRVLGHNAISGEPVDIIRTMVSNNFITRAAAASFMEDMIVSDQENYGIDIDSLQTVDVWRNSNMVVDKVVAGVVQYHLVG